MSIVHRSAEGAACCNQPVPTDDCCAAKVPLFGTCLYFWPPCPTAATTTTSTTTTTAAPTTNSTHPPCVTAGESCAEQGCCAALVCSLSDEICCLSDGEKSLTCHATAQSVVPATVISHNLLVSATSETAAEARTFVNDDFPFRNRKIF